MLRHHLSNMKADFTLSKVQSIKTLELNSQINLLTFSDFERRFRSEDVYSKLKKLVIHIDGLESNMKLREKLDIQRGSH